MIKYGFYGLRTYLLVLMIWCVRPTSAEAFTLTFDDVTSLNEYAVFGVTFSPNAGIWTNFRPSILVSPDGGAFSVPNALEFGNPGPALGSIRFATAMSSVSIWALSGPGPDLLNASVWIRAFDESGVEIGRDDADPSLQFDLLTISTSGIRRLDIFSPIPGEEVWDHLTANPQFGSDPVPVPDPGGRAFIVVVILCCAIRRWVGLLR